MFEKLEKWLIENDYKLVDVDRWRTYEKQFSTEMYSRLVKVIIYNLDKPQVDNVTVAAYNLHKNKYYNNNVFLNEADLIDFINVIREFEGWVCHG